jgi:cysteine sulfinate desulfinase/cysteine desulfurase-like protein
MGVAEELARGVIRLSFGETTTDAELEEAARTIAGVVAGQQRRASAVPGV